ncbi:MAG TPA: response regulator, partial [Methanoregula sp.]|nr:response regulator [Methanoregula sp.]
MISVLYVDDEPDLLELCRIFLEQAGDLRVDTIQSPLDVLLRLEEHPYDVVVCDYQMPDMDGISLLKQVRRKKSDIPFILFTGRGREEIVIEALNNGADFYLQKGGDVKAQFAELASKIRQAVKRRQAERSLKESEKMLNDIINFLPDATFAIDRVGTVIAWNRAIEEMTGILAEDIVGKGEYEYAIPFYGSRRPMLIDLIFESEEEIRKNYSGITREKDVLIAETDLPRPKGEKKVLMGKASPLYNQKDEIIGAIEAIRDITV